MQIRLILWDVDHTLIELNKLHYKMYEAAFKRAFGEVPTRLPDMSGRTDRDSSSEILEIHGLSSTEDSLRRLWDNFIPALEEIAPDLATMGFVLPGAREALQEIAEFGGTYQSVLTGNLRELAELKVTTFSLDRYLDLEIGGYGGDSLDRSALVAVARRRLQEKTGHDAAAEETLLIGDTPLDVAAAHNAGANVAAVATGASSAEQLAEAGADLVLKDLTDLTAVMDAVLRWGETS